MVVEPYPTEPGVEDEYNQSPKKIWTDGILLQNIIYSSGTVLEVTHR